MASGGRCPFAPALQAGNSTVAPESRRSPPGLARHRDGWPGRTSVEASGASDAPSVGVAPDVRFVSIHMSIGSAGTGPYEAGCRVRATLRIGREGHVVGRVLIARRDS